MASFEGFITCDSLVLLTISFPIIWSYIWYKRTYSFWSLRGVQGPTPLPFLGNLWPLLFQSYKKVDIENLKRYGTVYGYYDGTQPVLAISDPALLEKIYVSNYQDFPNFLDFTTEDAFDNLEIMNQEGLNWKRRRMIISSCFTGLQLKNAFAKTENCRKSITSYLESLKGQEVDSKLVFRLYALDVIGKVIFSVDVDAFNNQDSPMVTNVADFFFGYTAWNVLLLTNCPWVVPYLANSLTSENSKRYARQFSSHIVKSRANMSAHRSDDMVQILVDAISDDDTIEQEGKGVSEEEAIADALFLFGSSYDSSIATMSMAVWYLAHNTRIQDEILREINATCKAENITHDELNQLKYLEAVVMETLRMDTPSPRGYRRAVRDTVVPGTDIHVPKNQLISICFYAVHYDETNFHQPDRFIPERFLDDQGCLKKSLPFYAFGGGHRKCPAGNLAYLNVKGALVAILRRFKIERGPNTPDTILHEAGGLSLNPGNLFVRFVQR